nr:MAG TPA: Toxin SymE, type I toxin-antitoxin system [Caudoviricetes sp.]
MKNKNERILNVMFSKAGSGSISSKMALPKDWINSMGLSPDNRQVVAVFDEEKNSITIVPAKASK